MNQRFLNVLLPVLPGLFHSPLLYNEDKQGKEE